MPNAPDPLQPLIDDATYDYAMGDAHSALDKLRRATTTAPASFALWHTLAEISLGSGQLDAALDAAQHAHALHPDDLLINTTLSRIWVKRGDKTEAEKYGAQAKILGWKEQLREPEPALAPQSAGPANLATSD